MQNVISEVKSVKFGEQQLKFPVFGEGAAALLLTDNAKLGAVALADAFKTGTLEESSIDFVGEALNAVLPTVFQVLGITPTEEEITAAANEAYQGFFTDLETAFALAALEQTAPPATDPVEPTPEVATAVVEEAAEAGNSVAEAITNLPAAQQAEAAVAFTQLASVAQFGASTLNYIVANRKLQAAQAELETKHLEKLATMLNQAPAEIAAQLQAAATPAVPATVPA